MQKRDYNNAGFSAVSNFGLKVCVKSFKVPVFAQDEYSARQAAENICNIFTKENPKPNTVIVTLIGDGPPYKRGKPITVRARVMGEGDMSAATVQATFSNGDPPIFLKHAGGNFFEGQWIPTKIPSNARVESDGSVWFNVTVTVTAVGCDILQSVSDTADAQIRLGAIKFKFTGITEIDDIDQRVNNADEPWLRWNWSPGQEKVIHFKGIVVDEEGQPVPAAVSVQFQFYPMGLGSLEVENQQVSAPDGRFTFTHKFAIKMPGELKAFFEANHQEIAQLKTKKRITGVILGEYQIQANKEGYLFWRAKVRGRTEESQPVKISATTGTDIKELEISVLALQPDENGKLEWKPLEDAEVELIGISSKRKTNKDGRVTLKIPGVREGQTVQVDFELVPELDIKAVSVPKAYIAHPDASGKIYIFAGSKDGFEIVADKDGNIRAEPKVGAFLVSNRRFKVSISNGLGSLEGNIARPEQNNPYAHTITYRPPQSLPGEVSGVARLTIEDSEIPLYKTELTLMVFKDAFLTVRKLGFREDTQPIPIDLVEVNGVKVVPGIVSGVVQENPQPDSGRPINGVTVTAYVADKVKSTETGGEIGPNAGRFTLRELAENNKELQLQRPIVLPFLDFVEEFAHSFDGLRQLGYTTPRFREQDGFIDPVNDQPIFRYRWDLRYETDEQKLQRILDAIKRADAALRLTAEVDPMVKQYYKELIGAIVDLVLFFAGEKIVGKIAELLSVGKGIGKGVKLSKDASKALRDKLQKIAKEKGAPPFSESDLDVIETLVNDALRKHRGLDDKAIEEVKQNLNPGLRDVVEQALTSYRDELKDAIEMMVAGLKADILGFIKSALKKLRIVVETDGDEPQKGIQKAINFLIEQTVDSTLNAVLDLILKSSDLSPEALLGLPDKIADQIAEQLTTRLHRTHFQKHVDIGFRRLGRYEHLGDTNEAVRQIEAIKVEIENWRKIYEIARAPISSATSAFAQFINTPGFLEDIANLTGSIIDGILPVSSVATFIGAPIAIFRISQSVDKAWVKAVGWEPENFPPELISPFFPFPPVGPHLLPLLPRTTQFSPMRKGRQLQGNLLPSEAEAGNWTNTLRSSIRSSRQFKVATLIK
jgi:hypothetical protein